MSESHLDHHGARLALLRASRRRIQEGRSMISRRELIATAISIPLLKLPARSEGRFLTPAEYALLDELTELIIPTDAHSPGARAAGVAGYIDARLTESL